MIDYEKSFKKLVEQIDMERGFVINDQFNNGETEFNKGMFFAYDSIFRLAKKLENDEFFIEEDENSIEIGEAETVIYDRQGYAHDGYYCSMPGCPYAVDDCEGCSACYKEQYIRCKTEK